MSARSFCALLGVAAVFTSGCSFYGGVTRPHASGALANQPLTHREARVILVADPLYRAVPGWRGRLEGALKKVSRRWEPMFGISFTPVKIIAWNPPAHTLLMPLVSEYYALTELPRGDADLVIGVSFCSGMAFNGLTEMGGNYIMACASPSSSLSHVMEHEIAHTFGAKHTWALSAESPILLPWPFQPRWFSQSTKATILETAKRKLAPAVPAVAASTPAAGSEADGEQAPPLARLPQAATQ